MGDAAIPEQAVGEDARTDAAGYVRFFHGTLEHFGRLKVGTATKLIGGLVFVGSIGVFLPQNLSDGYPVIQEALAGKLSLRR